MARNERSPHSVHVTFGFNKSGFKEYDSNNFDSRVKRAKS